MSERLFVFVFGVVLAAQVSTLCAQNAAVPATVSVAPIVCSDAGFADSFRALLLVELRSDGVSLIEENANEHSLAHITLAGSCDAESVEVHIEDRATAKRVQRQVSLADVVAMDRARVLALAVVALLRASWAELAVGDPPREFVIPESVATATRARVANHISVDESLHEHPGTRLNAGFSGLFFTGTPTWLAGGFAGVSYRWFRAGVRAAAGTRPHALGEVDVVAVLLQLDFEVLHEDMDDARFALQLRALGGYGYLGARTSRADVFVASAHVLELGGALLGQMRLRVDANLALEFEIELGALSGGNGRAVAERVLTLDGVFAALNVGVLAF